MKGNRQGSLSRSITRRSDQNCKIILQILILQFCRQLIKKVLLDFFDKLVTPRRRCLRGIIYVFLFVVSVDKTTCQLVCGFVEDLLRRALLNDHAARHEDDPVRGALGKIHLVRNKDHCAADFLK